jgi:hypothetical protein
MEKNVKKLGHTKKKYEKNEKLIHEKKFLHLDGIMQIYCTLPSVYI